MKVVGTLFIENEKLLLDKPRKRPIHQLVGVRGSESVMRKSQYTSCFTKKSIFTPL